MKVDTGIRTLGLQSHNLAREPTALYPPYHFAIKQRETSLKGFEPPTHGLEVRCSIQLSYRLICVVTLILRAKRVMGIEPTYLAWKASVLPLNYTRISLKR